MQCKSRRYNRLVARSPLLTKSNRSWMNESFLPMGRGKVEYVNKDTLPECFKCSASQGGTIGLLQEVHC